MNRLLQILVVSATLLLTSTPTMAAYVRVRQRVVVNNAGVVYGRPVYRARFYGYGAPVYAPSYRVGRTYYANGAYIAPYRFVR